MILPEGMQLPCGLRVMVFAPHPDDETIGCGGSAALYGQAGIPVQALVMTDGSLWGEPPPGMGKIGRASCRERV